MKNLYLIGFMGAGKSTIARALAKKCPSKRIEMDQLIEEHQGMAITDIFAAHGENYFRDLETELLRSFSESTGYVVSCGGGSVLRDENAALMKENGCIVFLRATPETIYERVKDSTNRPILNGNMNVEYIRELMEKRRPRYEAVADICVDTDGKDVENISEEILKAVENRAYEGQQEMNFEFIRECRLESDELQAMYDNVLQELERAEHYYWRKPQECGIILRQTTERICRIYNTYYQIGYPQNASLEEFLCYTDENEHNVMVSRFLSVVRKEQRDRLNKLRVLGDDCIWGEEAPDQGMTFEDRMGQNARHMMETMMEVTKDMCEKINKRDDVFDEFFLEEALPETKEEAGKETLAAAEITTSAENTKKPLFARIFHR